MSSPLLIINRGVVGLVDIVEELLFCFFDCRGECKCDLSAYSASFPFTAWPSNADSHDHVIGLMGSAFNEGVLLDIDH